MTEKTLSYWNSMYKRLLRRFAPRNNVCIIALDCRKSSDCYTLLYQEARPPLCPMLSRRIVMRLYQRG